MIVIAHTSLQSIENHLLSLGGGNHPDNMERLARFDGHYLVSLAENEFLDLVFLQNDDVAKIAPRGCSRALSAVAERGIALGQPRLASNWDLADNLRRMREKLTSRSVFHEPLVICEARNGEEQCGPWYIQDGSHRALAYTTLMLLKETPYEPQTAYCSMSKRMYHSFLG